MTTIAINEIINARYIKVTNNDPTDGYVIVPELEVYNFNDDNVALNKPTSASSIYDNRLPEYMVDGNTNQVWGTGSGAGGVFAHTNKWESGEPEFIEVDLGAIINIKKIKVIQRTDWEGHINENFKLEIIDDNLNVVKTESLNYTNFIEYTYNEQPPLALTSMIMQDIINPNTTGTLTITFNQSIGEANLNAYVSLNPSYIGTLGEITSADGGLTYTGRVTRTPDMNRLNNKVNLNYNGITGEASYDVLSDSTLISNMSQIGSDIAGMSSTMAMSDNGETIAVGHRAYKGPLYTGEWHGITTVYKNINGTWTQLGNAFIGTNSESLGHYTILSGDGTRLAVSSDAYFNNSLKGSVSVYDWNGTNWVQVGSKLEGNTTNDKFGWGTDMSKDGNTVVIGAIGANFVKVYSYDVGTSDWVQKGNTLTGGSEFGGRTSISRDGNTIIVGEGGISINNNVKIYRYDVETNDWLQKGDTFTKGYQCKLSGDGEMLAITTELSSLSKLGTVKVYEWDGSSWRQKGNDINGNLLENTGFGMGINLNIRNENGIKLTISEYQRQNLGRVNIYEWDGANWVKKLNIDGTQNNEQFGYGVDMSRYGEQIVISSASSVTRVYNISRTIERTLLSVSLSDSTIKFPETGSTFEVKFSTNDKTIEEVQGNVTIDPIEAGTLTGVTLSNSGFSLVGTYNAATQTETTGNKLKYVEGELSGEVEFILSTAEKAISNICFRGEAKVLTREGYMEIREVKRGMRVQGEEIEEVTRTISKESEVVLMKAGSIMKNMPKEDTVITKEHKVLYKGRMVEAKELVNGSTIVYEKYNGETLYNILLSGEGKMVVNGMIVETLSPSNNIAKLYKIIKDYKEEEKKEIIRIYNEERNKKKR